VAIGPGSFAGSMVGFTMLTLGAVGFPVRRGWRATAERLGLRRIGWPEVALIGAGLLALVLLNAGMEWLARAWFPRMYARDQAMNELIAGRLTGFGTLMLGVSAGVGEELAMRGALMPRLGLVATSLLFASLHVQYSPPGMVTIGAIGLLLGIIRKRGGTTSAIAVHVLYDILAALGAQH
jgi:membrane protease YdiL (CAAX protease family)